MYNNQILINAHPWIQRRASKRQDNRPHVAIDAFIVVYSFVALVASVFVEGFDGRRPERKNIVQQHVFNQTKQDSFYVSQGLSEAELKCLSNLWKLED